MDIFKDLGVEVELSDDDSFLKIRETLSRIGISSKKDKVLYQSAHILHKQGKYAIMHFKELFSLDGKETNFNENDLARRNTIVNLLEEWKLLKIVDKTKTESPVVAINQIKILPYIEKHKWQLVCKYSIGNLNK